jgi:hypothetical protein
MWATAFTQRGPARSSLGAHAGQDRLPCWQGRNRAASGTRAQWERAAAGKLGAGDRRGLARPARAPPTRAHSTRRSTSPRCGNCRCCSSSKTTPGPSRYRNQNRQPLRTTACQGHLVVARRGEQPGDGGAYFAGADHDDIFHTPSGSTSEPYVCHTIYRRSRNSLSVRTGKGADGNEGTNHSQRQAAPRAAHRSQAMRLATVLKSLCSCCLSRA